MSRPNFSIADQLNAAQLAICNSLADTEIQAAVAGFGFTTAKLNEGKKLYDAALAAVNAQSLASGAQQDATSALETARKSAHDAYQALARVARASLPKAGLAALGLEGGEPRGTAGFLAAAYTLFDNAGKQPALAGFGYDATRLAAERAKITAYDTANQKQEAAKGAAQQSTRQQDAALQSLAAWVAQYLKIARVALRDKPQLLEKLGVAARTGLTQAQKEGRKKAAAKRAATAGG